VATFRRPDELRLCLQSLVGQSLPPTLIVVADNDPDQSARAVVDDADVGHSVATLYLPTGQNLGPAGAWARAARLAQQDPRRGDWLMVVDDDDPITDESASDQMMAIASATSGDVAAIGLRGARWRRVRASLQRVHPVGRAPQNCDYLASNGLPLYRWSVIDRVGFFDETLFFGFEDLELGLRLRTAGLLVQVAQLDTPFTVAGTSPTRTAWREYFKTRAVIITARRHLGWWAVSVTAIRSALLGGILLAIKERDPALARARGLGLLDGLRDKTFRARFVPSQNPAKSL